MGGLLPGRITPQTLIIAESLQGFDSVHDFKSAKRLPASLLGIEIPGLEIAIQAAKNYRVLRQRGVTIRKTIDNHCHSLHRERV